ncbi:MAG TPA: heparan-alpha-glucosaminide N-acetyltransferase domain-containing protein [Terrimicrobiaceae bacterium]
MALAIFIATGPGPSSIRGYSIIRNFHRIKDFPPADLLQETTLCCAQNIVAFVFGRAMHTTNIVASLSSASTITRTRNSTRIQWIDVMRGIAIVTMIPANFSPWLAAPHPFWLRIIGSYAAPAFIMLSAGMVILHGARHDLGYFLIRGAMILVFGAFIHIFVWRACPFISFDVLNVIGLALPIIYISRRWSILGLLCVGFLFFAVAPILQRLVGYEHEPLEIALTSVYWPGFGRVLKSWFVDGWFPIFPWLGFSFFGAAFFQTVFAEADDQPPRWIILLAAGALTLGVFLFFMPGTNLNEVVLEEREGYSELFYPPTIPYMLSALGVVLLLAVFAQKISHFRASSALSLLGRYSLFIYIFHQAAAAYLLDLGIRYFGGESIRSEGLFLLVALLQIAIAYCCCQIIERAKIRHPPHVLLWRMLFGK